MRTWRTNDEREGATAQVGAAEKLRIVLAGMQPGVEVSDLCRPERLNPVQFYTWRKQLLGPPTASSRTNGVGPTPASNGWKRKSPRSRRRTSS
jgi:transposase-like protein